MKAIQDNPLSVQNPCCYLFLPVEVPYFAMDENVEVDLDGFTRCSVPHHARNWVPYIMMDGKIAPVCGGRRPGRGKKYGAQV